MKTLTITLTAFIILLASCGSPSERETQEEQETTKPSTDSLTSSIQDLAWSPDGKVIYFSGMRHMPDYSDYIPEKWSIYRYELGSTKAIRIVDSALYVAVSSMGDQIAYGKMTNGNRDLYISDGHGKNPRKITSDPTDDYAASFSPNADRIVFNSKRNGQPNIYVINIDGTGLKQLTDLDSEGGYDNPQWSPDGQLVVFYYGAPNGRDQIYTMNPDGSEQKNITKDTLLNYFPGWMNSKRIIYTQNNKSGSEMIFTMAVDGTDRIPLMDIQSFYARVSPNGDLVAYVNEKEQCISVITMKGVLVEKIVFH